MHEDVDSSIYFKTQIYLILTIKRAPRFQLHMLAKLHEVQRFQGVVSEQIGIWTQRLNELRLRNDAAAEDERLPASDFIIDTGLQAELRKEGKCRAAIVSNAAKRLAFKTLHCKSNYIDCIWSRPVSPCVSTS